MVKRVSLLIAGFLEIGSDTGNESRVPKRFSVLMLRCKSFGVNLANSKKPYSKYVGKSEAAIFVRSLRKS